MNETEHKIIATITTHLEDDNTTVDVKFDEQVTASDIGATIASMIIELKERGDWSTDEVLDRIKETLKDIL